VIQRAASLVDRLVIGIGINLEKTPLFTPEERADLVRSSTAEIPNIDVHFFTGLAVEFVRQVGSRVMIRGVRPLTDISGEFTMAMANRHLDPSIETVFLMADEEFAHVSSSLLKQITPLASDEMLARFVPRSIIAALRAKLPAEG
jgi:pantetheine-phosphate adenylyltransferase